MSTGLTVTESTNTIEVTEPNSFRVVAENETVIVEAAPVLLSITSVTPIGFEAENKSGTALSAGCVVAKHNSGSGAIKADASTPLSAVGLVTTDRADTEVGTVQTDGVITLTDWTAVIGSVYLASNATYYLSTTAGMLTTTPPSGNGQIVQVIGRAMSPTILDISIASTITRRT